MRINSKSLLVSLVFSFIYIYLAWYWSSNILISSDTFEYYYAFNNIEYNTYLWFPELFTSFSMLVFSKLGFEFNIYLFFNNIIWLPLVFLFFYHSKKDLFLFVLGFFFLTYIFFVNNSFLIRQFQSFLFFCLYFIFKEKKYKYIFGILSLSSHLSAILFFILSYKKISYIILNNKLVIFIIFIILFFSGFYNYILLIFDYFYSLSNLGVFSKKIMDSQGYIDNIEDQANSYILGANFLVILLILFNRKINKHSSGFYSLIFISSIILILFREQVVMSNRLGFVSFYFLLPCIILSLRSYHVK